MAREWGHKFLGEAAEAPEIISVGVVIGEMSSVYCRNGEIDRVSKELGRMILLVAGDAVDLIVVMVEKARDGIF